MKGRDRRLSVAGGGDMGGEGEGVGGGGGGFFEGFFLLKGLVITVLTRRLIFFNMAELRGIYAIWVKLEGFDCQLR